MRSEVQTGVLREGEDARGGSASPPPSAPRPQVIPMSRRRVLALLTPLVTPGDDHVQAPPKDLSSQWAALEGKLESAAQEAEAGELVVGAEKHSTEHKKKDFKVRPPFSCVCLSSRTPQPPRICVGRTSARRTTTSSSGSRSCGRKWRGARWTTRTSERSPRPLPRRIGAAPMPAAACVWPLPVCARAGTFVVLFLRVFVNRDIFFVGAGAVHKSRIWIIQSKNEHRAPSELQ